MDLSTIRVEDVAEHAAAVFVETMLAAIRDRGRFTTALAGGNTPKPLYRLLATRRDLPWEHAHVFVGDERFVADTHADSNFGAIRATLLDHVDIPAGQVHPWPIEDDPSASATRYAATLDDAMRGQPFDLTLLGLGADGHTAGIFPNQGLTDASAATVAYDPAGTEHARLSLTPRRLSESRTVAFLVSGKEKRGALERLTAAEGDREQTPARAIAALERLLAITDITA